jgi:hypothetical protein
MRYVTTIYVFLTIAYLTPVHAADLSEKKTKPSSSQMSKVL